MSQPVELRDVLTWEVERIRRDAAALVLLVNAALEAPEPERQRTVAKLLQVVESTVTRHVCQPLSTQLVELLERPDADRRYIGARLLLTAGEVPAALAGLRRGLGDADARVRGACVQVLRAARLEPEALLQHLRSEREGERQAVLELEGASLRAEAVHGLRVPGLRDEAVPVLLDALRTDAEAAVREAAAEVLEELAPVRPEVAQALVDALIDVEPQVGARAAASLARRGPTTEAVVPRLFAALEDPGLRDVVRGGVALTLARLGERAVVPVLVRLLGLPDSAFGEGIDEVTGLPAPPLLKLELVRAVDALGPLAAEAVPVLLQCVRTGLGMLQVEAAEVVGRMGTARAELEALLCEVLPQAERGVRPSLLEVLARQKPEGDGALRELVKALEDESPWVQDSAHVHLWHVVGERPELIERLLAFSRDEDPRVRSAAHEALRVLRRPTAESLARLARQLESAAEDAREAAIVELRILGLRAGGLLPELLVRLPGLGPEARAAVLSVIGPLRGGTLDPALREALVAGLEDAEARVREAAVWALGDLSERDAQLLRRAEARRTDGEPKVREAVEATLQALGAGPAQEPPDAVTGAPEDAAWALRELALTLYAALREGEGNRVFSPLSVFTLLALVLRGTRGHTEAALRRALHWAAEPSLLSAALRALTERLHVSASQESSPQAGDEGFALVSANGFWPQEGHPLRQEYVAELAEAFGVRPTPVDFAGAPEAASQALNAWVHEQTRGRIPAIAPPEGLPRATRYVLANAVYFRSRWEKPFDDDTREAPFHLLDGQQVTVPMMGREGCFGYARGPRCQLLELPYRGRQTSMVVLLPEAGFFERFERLLSGERLETLLAQRTWESFVLRMPRFGFDQHVDLTGLAERLGLSALFEPDVDLSGMTPTREPLTGRLMHDASLTVDEKGAEAAAATRVFHIGGMPQVVEVNRPFLFLIRHVETAAVLFLGRVLDPRPSR
ncbi:hypothetical protein JQX13_42280 [Archangium violaceum]|uniref:serpin family protein n=1 Tax=Archangium violaceum TaxID=83451 RepID=UPI00193BF4EE|nr:serpin family protein [Archangium violaceum]QRK06643.1 hypothetical protein JQX13_42280 [Archangium violaceum]